MAPRSIVYKTYKKIAPSDSVVVVAAFDERTERELLEGGWGIGMKVIPNRLGLVVGEQKNDAVKNEIVNYERCQ